MGAQFFHDPIGQLGLDGVGELIHVYTLHATQPFFLFHFEQWFQFTQVIAAELYPVRQRDTTCGGEPFFFQCASVFQEHAMAQSAEQGLGDQGSLIGADAFLLEEVAQHGIGRVFHLECGTHGLDGEIETIFGE